MTLSPLRANAPGQRQRPVGSHQTGQDFPENTAVGKEAQAQLSTPDERVAVLAHFTEEMFSTVSDTDLVGDLLKTIQRWTGHDLLLTRLVCHHVLATADQIEEGHGVDRVNTIVRETVLDHWETNDAGAYLRSIRDGLLGYPQRDSLLIVYIQILQRGAIAENQSPEQAALLESGLVTLVDDQLQVANAIYATIFDLDWVEAQLPGITRPVMIVRSQAENSHPSSLSKRYSQLTVLACGVAVLVAASSMYLKEGGEPPVEGQQAIATETPNRSTAPEAPSTFVGETGSGTVIQAEDTAIIETATATDKTVSDRTVSDKAVVSDRALFDNGITHATNGRWLPMLREFCAISVESTYFTPAERQIGRWWSLYPEDLLVATETFVAEGNASCPVVEVMN